MKNKPFKMLCIDASTKHFGFALYQNGELISPFGKTFGDVYTLDKLRTMREYFSGMYEEYQLDHIVIEQPVPMQFSGAIVQINQVVGMIFGVALEKGISIDWVHNRTAKKLVGVTKKGKEGKLQSIELMKAKYPEFADAIVNDHISDAIVVGEAYKQICKE